MTDAYIAIILVVVGIVLVISFLRYKAKTSEKRMLQMLRTAGLDPEITVHDGSEAIMREVRRRCRKCQSEGLCEQWLAGKVEGNNDFCPNAQVFEALKSTHPA
jgi:hypothetical protein